MSYETNRLRIYPRSLANLAPIIALVRSLIPTYMNADTYTWAYLGLSTEGERGTNTTSFPLQCPPARAATYEGWTNSRTRDVPVCILCNNYPQLGPQVNEEARFPVNCIAPPLY